MITEQVRVQSCQNVLEKECNNANKKIEDAEAPGILVSDVPSFSTPAQQRVPRVPVDNEGSDVQEPEPGVSVHGQASDVPAKKIKRLEMCPVSFHLNLD